MKRIGFLSFGHWSDSPHSQARTAADVLQQSIELAVAVAIHARVARELPFDRLAPRYFFESDLLFRLNTLRAVLVAMAFLASIYLAFNGQWLATLVLSQRLTTHLRAGASAHHTGERTDYDFGRSAFVVLDPFTTLDVYADWVLPLAWSGVDLAATLRIENAFDDRHQYVFGFDAPGRTVLLGVRMAVE